MTDKYDLAVRVWLARKLMGYSYNGGSFYEAEMITDVSFGEDDGYYYSEYTWEDDKPVIQFKVNGKKGHIQILDMPPAKMIQECMEIYKTLVHLKY